MHGVLQLDSTAEKIIKMLLTSHASHYNENELHDMTT